MSQFTYIILYRRGSDPAREENLYYVLSWLKKKLVDYKYEVLICEQDDKPHFTRPTEAPENLRHLFLYNPQEFNRGWGFNCAVKTCQTSVVILGDADLIFLNSFALTDAIKLCSDGTYDVVSPYQHVFKTNDHQRNRILSQNFISLDDLTSTNMCSYYTVGGGLTVIKREIFEKIGGFEEHDGWGLEDRSFDVCLERCLKPDRVSTLPYLAIHLNHALCQDRRGLAIFGHRMATHSKVYGCPTPDYTKQYLHRNHQKLAHNDSPHRFCQHQLDKTQVIVPISQRGNQNKYKILVVITGNLKKLDPQYDIYDLFIIDPDDQFVELNRPKYIYLTGKNPHRDFTESTSVKTIYARDSLASNHPLYHKSRIKRHHSERNALQLAKELRYLEVILNNKHKKL